MLKKLFVGAGCRVLASSRTFGELSRAGVNYLIFREKVPEADHSHIWYFLISKQSKSLTQ
ncbi:hypothetical protein [Microcystis sp.]|uniref:hypothetical protein n=1 Tax=Microcystis sp. TaxID=1127 RepID=UPI00391A632E